MTAAVGSVPPGAVDGAEEIEAEVAAEDAALEDDDDEEEDEEAAGTITTRSPRICSIYSDSLAVC